MKTKVILLAFVALIVSACNETSEDKVFEAFEEYVNTDFGNPYDFMGITQYGKKDTVSNKYLKESIGKLDSVLWLMTDQQKAKKERLTKKLDADSIFIVQHEIKVRMRDKNGIPQVNEYYVIEKPDGWTVQDHALRTDELPEEFGEVLSLIKEVTVSLDFLNSLY